MSIRAKIIALLTTIFLVALGFIFSLNVMKFDTMLHDLAKDRAGIVLGEVGQSLRLAIELGLSLETLESGRALREHAKTKDPAILDLILFGADGRVVDSASASMLDTPIPPSWFASHQHSQGEQWTVVEEERLMTGVPFDTRLGIRAGGVVLVRSLEEEHQRVSDAFVELAIAGAVVLGLMFVLALPGCLFLSRRLRHFLSALERRIADEKVSEGDEAILSAGLARLVDTFSRRARQLDTAISDADAEIQGKRLDRV